MAEEKRLIGDDGKLARGSLASVATTDTLIAESWYLITKKAAVGSIFGDLVVNDFYYAPIEMTLTAGDEAKLLTLSTLVDLSGWSLEITGDEIEVTVLDDKFKKYRKGKLDATGSATFIFIKGETDSADNLANYFFDNVVITASGTVTKTDKKENTLYMVGYLDDTSISGEAQLATVMQVEFFDFPLNMNSSEAVEIETPFRLAGDTDPILYRIVNA